MDQKAYDNWVSDTDSRQQDSYCGGHRVSCNEKYFISNYATSKILDIGCGTGRRTFPIWLKNHIRFYGIEAFDNLIRDSKYSQYIIHGKVGADNFQTVVNTTMQKMELQENETFDIVFFLGGVVNSFIDYDHRLKSWSDIEYLSLKSKYILIDTLSHFEWFYNSEKGKIIQLMPTFPPQYFYSKKELFKLFDEHNLKQCEEREEDLNTIKRTHFLLSKK